METIKNKSYTKSESYNVDQDLNEDWLENGLLLAGFVPVIGDVADIVLIIKYLKEKRYLEAGIMLFCLIPVVGNLIFAPFLKLGRAAGAFSSGAKLMNWLSKDAKAMELYQKGGKFFKNAKLNELIGDVAKVSPKWSAEMKAAQEMHIGIIPSVGGVGKTAVKNGAGTAVKKSFQRQALGKYLVKTGGVEPATFLSRWWNVNYKGSRLRKQFFTKLLMTSNFLSNFGFSLEDLEKKMSTPEGADELLKDPKFAELYNRTTTQEEKDGLVNTYSGNKQEEPGILSKISGIGGGFIGINTLKMVAKLVI